MKPATQQLTPLLLIVVTCLFSGSAWAQSSDGSAHRAVALFKSGDWSKAAAAFEEITRADPSDGQGWFRLAYSYYRLGEYQRAIEAYKHAIEIRSNPVAMYNLACCYSLLKQKDKAFEWLDRALASGFTQLKSLETDSDLAVLRDDPRFQHLLSAADRLIKPCQYDSQYKQFDFWIGEWNVKSGNQQAGTNSVQKILDGCIVFENWTGSGGGTGKSFNFYNATTRRWQQTWVSSSGAVLELSGEYKDDAMRLAGETVGPNGSIRHRLTFFNLSPDRVRQLWEQSTDGGKSWNVAFDGEYIRVKEKGGNQ